MKIVVIHGHAATLLDQHGPLFRSMVELGHQVHALAPAEDPEVAVRFETLGVEFSMFPLTRHGFTPVADIGSLLHLKQVLFRIRPDMVLSTTAKAVVYGAMAARMAWVGEKKQVFALVEQVNRDFDRGSGLKRRLLFHIAKALHKAGFKSCDGILFRSSGDEVFFRRLGIIPDHVRTAPIEGDKPDRAILSFIGLI